MANLEEDFYGTFSKKGKLLFGLERAVNVHFSELCFFTLNFINLSTLMEGMEGQSSKLLHFSFFFSLVSKCHKEHHCLYSQRVLWISDVVQKQITKRNINESSFCDTSHGHGFLFYFLFASILDMSIKNHVLIYELKIVLNKSSFCFFLCTQVHDT